MRVLLDNCVPAGIRRFLIGHTVTHSVTVGLADVNKGDLIKAADYNYEIFVTSDLNIRYQQKFSDRKLAIVAVATNHWPTTQTDPGKVTQAVNAATAGSYQLVTYPKQLLKRRLFVPPKP